ncbi:MAG: hypothetical protein COA85_04400 [Robiginitomaculum sp.]|nr:MAG: hypothetical protein COA85_04400 [Robiginitomaculum sp.]
MSRISSISTAARPKDQSAFVRPVPKVPSSALALVPRESRRAAHRVQIPQSAAYRAQVLAGTPRRGLKGDPVEQARVFATYARVQNGMAPMGSHLKIVA